MRKAGILALLMLIVWALPIQASELQTENESEELTITIAVDDEILELETPALFEHNRVFVPAREFVTYFSGTVTWDEAEKGLNIQSTDGENIGFFVDQPKVIVHDTEYSLDVAPFMLDGKAYLPLRHIAEFLHINVVWDEDSYTAILDPVPLHVKGEGESLGDISTEYQTTPQLIMERNGITDLSKLKPGDALKVVIPYVMQVEVQPLVLEEVVEQTDDQEDKQAMAQAIMESEDFKLLAKIVQVEAGWESYEGQLAVANVVLNRVEDPMFPNTIHDVIYAPGQFPPAHNGLLDAAVPNESVKQATLAAMTGENNIEGALYFHNPKVSSGAFWESLTLIAEIGNHRFYDR